MQIEIGIAKFYHTRYVLKQSRSLLFLSISCQFVDIIIENKDKMWQIIRHYNFEYSTLLYLEGDEVCLNEEIFYNRRRTFRASFHTSRSYGIFVS